MRKRLDVQIDEERYDYIKEASDKSGVPMNVLTDELLSVGIAVKRGEVIEQQSLPVIREIIGTELRKHLAQQREGIREDMSIEIMNEIKAISRASDNRLAALTVRAVRDAAIAVRLLYAILARSFTPEIARATLEDAKIKTGKELAPNRKDDDV